MDELKKRLEVLEADFLEAWGRLNLDQKLKEVENLTAETSDPEIWKDPKVAAEKNQKLANLETEVHPWELLKTQISDLGDLLELSEADLVPEIERELSEMEKNFANLKKALRFSGPYDSENAILRITSGAGGVEAMDWAGILERMYLRFFEKNGFKAELLERSAGEEAGIKTAVYEVSGPHAYGTLKSEHGTHRLVRLSPFNAQHLRETSFALVEVLPALKNDEAVKIDEKDIRVDVYHASGHGGQGVNTTDSAVRITHLPTGIVVAIQNERSQHQNRDKAMEILRGKLAEMQLEQHAASIGELRAGESASWGQQIRNYVLQPYQLVKDTRTGFESTNPAAVLDGDLMPFIDAYLESILGKE